MQKLTFSLLKAINYRVNGEKPDKDTAEFYKIGKEMQRRNNLHISGEILLPLLETRATLKATSVNSGQENVGIDTVGLVAPLRANLVTVQAGATLLTGLVGNVHIPTYSGSNALWKGEGVTAVDGAGSTDKVAMAPKRLTTFIDVSKQFLLQDSSGAEQMLYDDLAAAVAGKLESAIFGKEAGSATQPAGFFNIAPAINGSASFAKVISLETAVSTANALKNGSYITNAAGRAILKQTPKVPNATGYLVEPDGTMNGYPLLVTNHVASGLQAGADEEGLIFGNFPDLVIGQWGAIELIVDTITRAAFGEVRIHVIAYVDAAARHASAFSCSSIKL